MLVVPSHGYVFLLSLSQHNGAVVNDKMLVVNGSYTVTPLESITTLNCWLMFPISWFSHHQQQQPHLQQPKQVLAQGAFELGLNSH